MSDGRRGCWYQTVESKRGVIIFSTNLTLDDGISLPFIPLQFNFNSCLLASMLYEFGYFFCPSKVLKCRLVNNKELPYSIQGRPTAGLHPSPKQMAQTMVDFPVPFGPITMFKFGPGKTSTWEYVTKFLTLIRTMLPGWNG